MFTQSTDIRFPKDTLKYLFTYFNVYVIFYITDFLLETAIEYPPCCTCERPLYITVATLKL